MNKMRTSNKNSIKFSSVKGYDFSGKKVRSIRKDGSLMVENKSDLIYDIEHLDHDYFYRFLDGYSYAELKEMFLNILEDKKFNGCTIVYPNGDSVTFEYVEETETIESNKQVEQVEPVEETYNTELSFEAIYSEAKTELYELDDYSTLDPLFNGSYLNTVNRQNETVKKGIELFLSAVGEDVIFYRSGKRTKTTVCRISFKNGFYTIEMNGGLEFGFKKAGFFALGCHKSFYGLVDDLKAKNGIEFL